MKKTLLCAVALASLAFGANIDKSLLVGKRWLCSETIESGEFSGWTKFNKDGTFSLSASLNINGAQKYTMKIETTGDWKLNKDKLFTKDKTFKATSKENPQAAKAYETLWKIGSEQNEEEDYSIITGLTSSKLTLKDADSDEERVCVAK
ncbi:MAG: hypothetical protein LBF86_02855 [Helicobacteraceae bacterium]|jgi:hypothetical protein|nr:hypothetical protein [Helicobacteraceae bacterium]